MADEAMGAGYGVSLMERKMSDAAVEAYWQKHYLDRHCTLCANWGIIDSRASGITPAGFRVGRLNFCICPNGQSLREQNADIESWFRGRSTEAWGKDPNAD